MELNLDVIRANLIDAKNWKRTQRGALVREYQGMRLTVLWTKHGYRWAIESEGTTRTSDRTFNTEGQALKSLADAVINSMRPQTEGMT